MAVCNLCGGQVSVVDGGYYVAHDPSCPHFKGRKPTIQRAHPNSVSSRADKADLFAAAWPDDFPQPEREYRFHPIRRWRFDFAFPAHMIAVEVDGNAWWVKGGGRHGQDSDLEKLNEAASLGWRVFRFSPKMLRNDPTGCVATVTSALEMV